MSPSDSTSDLPGLPSGPVQRWLRDALPETDLDGWDASIISGGLSNITYRVAVADGRYILRRPPLGHVLPRAHDMAREYRILDALWPTPVPVPEPIALCTDVEVAGAPFYLMREVAGEILRTPEQVAALSVQQRRGVGEALIQALADLHAVDPDEVGLGDYGRREAYAARQLRTWRGQWERSRTRELPDMERLLAILDDRVPPDTESRIAHGDYRLDNTIVSLDGDPSVEAILDWELSTLGEPLGDLGLMLTYWHDLGDDERAQIPVAAGVTAHEGFPTGAEVAQRYAELTGRSLDHLDFYTALGTMKLAVILEGVHSRYLSGLSVSDGYEGVGAAVPLLVARGLQLVGR
ncbi:phosphotransferase family protein [Jatrophihabitans sp.]|uniref:phosphotransferase family protein n=1 Tax=Jatrophihabitans sp. TaxID=1932789 RepID=UPI0030C74433|nr:putative phosphotransferase [Jatrophihabitans sp.]